jgi:hypothetical protein
MVTGWIAKARVARSSNEGKMKMEEKEQSKRDHWIQQAAVDLKAFSFAIEVNVAGDWHRFDIGIEWVEQSRSTEFVTEMRRTKMCFLFSRSVLSQYRTKKLEKGTKWKAFLSLASMSELRLELVPLHRLSFGSVQWPSWFHLREFFLLMALFCHMRDISPDGK